MMPYGAWAMHTPLRYGPLRAPAFVTLHLTETAQQLPERWGPLVSSSGA